MDERTTPNILDTSAPNGEIPSSRIALLATGEPLIVRGHFVDELIFTQGFVEYCDISKCSGGCCHSGVYADLGERERILAHAEKIAAVMYPSQPKSPEAWFDGEVIDDTDFPSGKAEGTATHSRNGGLSGFDEGCVFLDDRHFCSLQVAAADAGLHRWAWKPDYCILFPITVVEKVITYDDSHSEDLHHCGPKGISGYVRSVFEAMTEELTYFLGAEEFQRLHDYFELHRGRFESERSARTTNRAVIQISI